MKWANLIIVLTLITCCFACKDDVEVIGPKNLGTMSAFVNGNDWEATLVTGQLADSVFSITGEGIGEMSIDVSDFGGPGDYDLSSINSLAIWLPNDSISRGQVFASGDGGGFGAISISQVGNRFSGIFNFKGGNGLDMGEEVVVEDGVFEIVFETE